MQFNPRITRRAAGLGLLGTALTLRGGTARQGVSPFGEATPVGTSAEGGWRIADVMALDLDGIACALSPDGQWVAGIGPDRELGIWSVPDLEPTLIPVEEAIEADSIAWAPDSSAVAFSVEAFLRGTDGDIFVYELGDDAVRNLTDDGFEGGFIGSGAPTTPIPIDVMPVWTPDSAAIVFARSIWDSEAESVPTAIVRVGRDGGEAETLMSVDARPFSIFTPMMALDDGSILYTFAFADVDDPMNGLWKLDPDGTTTQLMAGTGNDPFPTPILLDAGLVDDELSILGVSGALLGTGNSSQPWLFQWTSSTGEAEPVETDETLRPLSATWSPDGGTMLVIGRQLAGESGVAVETIGPAAELTVLPEGAGGTGRGPRWAIPTWSATNTVLIPAIGSPPYLLTVEPVGT